MVAMGALCGLLLVALLAGAGPWASKSIERKICHVRETRR
jgi:hypothetical protein